MTDSASALSSWATYYAIVGSSGGALVGLQFVVIALVADKRDRVAEGSLSAFGTPTVVHLASALVVSAIMSAPWPSLMSLAAVLALCGLGGLAYGVTVVRRARRQGDYEPVWEDWLWHAALPCACYATLTVMALVLGSDPQLALFAVGGVALGLLLIGIHNAWDTVVYIMVTGPDDGAKKKTES
jgi:hypothetical protein